MTTTNLKCALKRMLRRSGLLLALGAGLGASSQALAWSTVPGSSGFHPELLSQAVCTYDANNRYGPSNHYYSGKINGMEIWGRGSGGANTELGIGGYGFHVSGGRRYFVGPFAESVSRRVGRETQTTHYYQICYVLDNQAPSVGNTSLSTNEDTTGAVNLYASDPNAGDTHSFQIVSGPPTGSAWISGSTLYYAPATNWHGTTSLVYRAVDNKGAVSNNATATLYVNPVNDPPLMVLNAAQSTLTTPEDTPISVSLSVNDPDSGDTHSYELVSGPAAGTVSISGSRLTYTPPANWSGAVSFVVRARDASGVYSNNVAISVTVTPVNDAPVAQAKSLVTNEDVPGYVTLSGTDIDSPTPSVFQVVSAPSATHGTVSLSGATATFTPAANWNGNTSFTYRVQDSAGAWSAPATVTVSVLAVNDAPSVSDLTMSTNEDTPAGLTLLVSDVDLAREGDSHTFHVVSPPSSAHGSVAISGTHLTFVPAADWNGTTSFTYRAVDSRGASSNTATVTVTVFPVNDAPIAQPKRLVTDEDTPASVILSGTDIDSPVPSVFQIVSGLNPAHGAISLAGADVTFNPALNWHGSTSFTYRVQDTAGAWSAPATVSITVNPVNDVPVITDITRRTNMDVAKTMALSVEDPDIGDAHTYAIVQHPSAAAGKVTITGSTMVFTPADGWTGSTSFKYQVADKAGAKSNVATVHITVVPLFQVVSSCKTPVAGDDFRFVLEDAGESGLGVSSFHVDLSFGGEQALRVPVTMHTTGSWATGIVADTSSILATAEFAEGFNQANYVSAANGGQKPYTFTVYAEARNGEKRQHSRTYDPIVREDVKAPEVTIFAGAPEGEGTTLRSIDDVTITVKDDKTGVDARSAQFYVSVGDKRVPFFILPESQSAVSDNRCVARYPLELRYTTAQMAYDEPLIVDLMVDAYRDGLPITLEVEFVDFAGNKTGVSKTLDFAPDVLQVNAKKIPGLTHVFSRTNGKPIGRITGQDAASELGSVVDYHARLLNESDTALVVNGLHVTAGEAVELGQFELARGKSIDLDIAAAADGVNGEATLLLVPQGKGGRMIRMPVTIWYPQTDLTSNNWSPVQLFQLAEASATQKNPAGCSFTGVASNARYADPIANPVCLIEWVTLPPDTYSPAHNKPEMTGRIPEPGQYEVAYQVVLFDTDGNRFIIGEERNVFDVIPAKEKMSFSLGSALDNSYRIVREVTGKLSQSTGPSCSTLTLDEEFANDLSAYNTPACLITWEILPDGIYQAEWTDAPTIGGSFDQQEGDARFAWSVASYSTKGVRVEIMEGEQVVPLQDPPTPVISMADKRKLADSLYWAPKNGGLVGDFTVKALSAHLKVDLLESGAVLESDETYGGYTEQLTYTGRLLATPKALWSKTPYEVRAAYSAMPYVNAELGFNVLAVPDEELRPSIEVAETTVLNTEALNVVSGISHPFEKDVPYAAEEMGEWEIRLLNYLSFSNQEPLTDFQQIDVAGKTSFDLDLKPLNAEYVRVMPEARLISPVPEYQRTVMGSRPLYITVLRGEAIDSRVDARRIRGEAPLNLMAKLDLTNRLDYKALGKVVWEVRKIGAGDWEQVENNTTMPDRFQHTFEVGRYEMRAHVFNKNSGAEFTTEAIEVHAYEVPRITIAGPANAFIGDTARLRVQALLDGVAVDADRMVVQWSEDNGETWFDGSVDHAIQRDTEERVMLMTRVRMKDSPADWEDSYVERRHRVAFRPVSPPRGSILGSRVVEEGVPVDWRGRARAPYPRMDVTIKGRFILPDGRVIDQDQVQYLPTDEDAKNERIEVSYESWIVGFEDQGARSTVTRRISVWKYQWPDWSMNVRTSATQAPADIDLRIRKPVGMGSYLENVQYQWEIPAGVEVVTARTVDSRSLRIKEPGVYPVKVQISDARGNFTELVEEITIDPPDPWEVDFRVSMSNVDSRAPLDLRLSPNVKGGHPQDRIETYRYYLDGSLLSDGIRYSSATLDAGKHELALEIESQLGEIVRATKEVDVKPNTPPVCELQATESSGRWRFMANCVDKTGRVAKHVWTVNGEPVLLSGSRITVTSRENAVLEVSLKAIDDGGAESNEVLWHGSIGGSAQ